MAKRTQVWPRGYYHVIMPGLWDTYLDGKITELEMIFLLKIESLTQHGIQKSPHGCYPSNEYLANCEGCGLERIRKLLHGLKKKKLLVFKFRGNKRYIKTCWSDAVRDNIKKRTKR